MQSASLEHFIYKYSTVQQKTFPSSQMKYQDPRTKSSNTQTKKVNPEHQDKQIAYWN